MVRNSVRRAIPTKVAIAAVVGLIIASGVGVYFYSNKPNHAPSGSPSERFTFTGPSIANLPTRLPSEVKPPRDDIPSFAQYVDAAFFGVATSAKGVMRGGVPYTEFTVDVEDSIKGTVSGVVTILQIGGKVDGKLYYSDGVTPVNVGRKTFFGVKRMEDGALVAASGYGAEEVGIDSTELSIQLLLAEFKR